MGLSENVGYIPNEIAIFHRDNDQQNHWVQWGTLYIFRHTHISLFAIAARRFGQSPSSETALSTEHCFDLEFSQQPGNFGCIKKATKSVRLRVQSDALSKGSGKCFRNSPFARIARTFLLVLIPRWHWLAMCFFSQPRCETQVVLGACSSVALLGQRCTKGSHGSPQSRCITWCEEKTGDVVKCHDMCFCSHHPNFLWINKNSANNPKVKTFEFVKTGYLHLPFFVETKLGIGADCRCKAPNSRLLRQNWDTKSENLPANVLHQKV